MKELQGTTHSGVSSQDGAATDQAVLSPRDLAMQEIEQQLSGQQVPDYLAGQGQEPAAAASAPVLPERLADEQLNATKVQVKIDGEVVELPLSEVVKGYQKDAVASRRLAQAAEERKRLEQERAEWERMRQAQPQGKGPQTEGGDAPSAEDDVDAQIRVAMAALTEGDEDAAAAALKALLGRGNATPQIDEEALAAKAAERIEAKQAEKDRAETWDKFVSDNPRFADQNSKERQYGDYLFNTLYGPQWQAGEISYREALEKCAVDVDTVFKAPVSQDPKPNKAARKESLDSLPVASGARAAQPVQQSETVDDVIMEMMRGRGQPV